MNDVLRLTHHEGSQAVILASFPGLQSPYKVEGLVKLLHGMTSGRRYR